MKTTKKTKKSPSKVARVENAIDNTLAGEDVEKVMAMLSEDEKTLYYELLELMKAEGGVSLDDLWNIDYFHKPPTMKEFVEDPYYLGNRTVRDEDGHGGLFPTWKDILIRDFDLDSRVNNVVITGSLGIGKTHIMILLLLYRIAVTRLLRNPSAYFGFSKGSPIFFGILSTTKGVVKDTALGELFSFMGQSAFFKEVCGYDPDQEYSSFRVNLGNNLSLVAGSKSWHILGRNTVGIGLDEGNWRVESKPDNKAYELYQDMRTRIKNRFQKISGYLPAITILASSARDESSFTEMVIDEINSSNDSSQRVYRMASYVVKPSEKPPRAYFKMAYGLKNAEPYMLGGWYHKNGELIPDYKSVHSSHNAAHEEAARGAQVELVPEDFYPEFLRRPRQSLQNISGISTGGSFRLFSSSIDIEVAITASEHDGVLNPTLPGIDTIPISEEDNKEIWDYLDHNTFLQIINSIVHPRRHPYALRYAHVDLAKVSMCGISVGHIIGNTLVEGIVDKGVPYSEYRHVFEYDFILTIVAGNARPISFIKLQKFFFWLRNQCNYRFGKITYDMYQSEMPTQMLQAENFNVGYLSMDRTKSPYYAWRSGFEERRIRLYRQAQMMREAGQLIDGEKKIDHPADGSKDTTDSAAGAYYTAITDEENLASNQNVNIAVPYAQGGVGYAQEEEEAPITIKTTPETPRPTVFQA